MKHFILILLTTFALTSCKKEATYVKLSGKVLNPNGKELNLHSLEDGNQLKTFTLKEDGTFSDTITLDKGRYFLTDGVKNLLLYLAPGTDLNISFDANDLEKTLKFEGEGDEINNYISQKMFKQTNYIQEIDSVLTLDQEAFITKLNDLESEYTAELKSHTGFDPEFVSVDSTDTKGFLAYIQEIYVKTSELNKMIGQPSPAFENYMNFNGGTTSLKDLKGKYVYIDVWATWCKPCVAEIPALKELEAELGDKIYFVSISVDEPASIETWKKTVTEKQMKGIQLFANADAETPFDIAYKINSIPRFILIDPAGNVVKPDASRPSNPKTKEYLKTLVSK